MDLVSGAKFVWVTLFWIFIGLFSCPVKGHAGGSGAVFHEERLLAYLQEGYVKQARPVLNAEDAVNVSVSFDFVRIEDLIETTDTFAVTMLIAQYWMDSRLRWNMSDFGGLMSVRMAKDMLWIPDIVLYNVAVQGTPQPRYEDLIMVWSTGHVSWMPMITVYATCPMDLTRFPYDIQTCKLVFGSWTHSDLSMNISFAGDPEPTSSAGEIEITPVDTFDLDEHPQWQLIDNKGKATITKRKYQCCVDTYSVMTVTCRLARKPQFYRYLTVGPAAVLGLLVAMIFLLPANSKEKTTYGLLLLVCLTVMMLILETAIPFSHGSLPHLLSFYLGTMILTGFSIMLSVMIINLSGQGTRHRPLPAWIRTIFLGRMGIRCMLCLGKYSPVDNVYSTALRSDEALLYDARSPSMADDDVLTTVPLSSSPPPPPLAQGVGSPAAPQPPLTQTQQLPSGASSLTDQHLREIHRCVKFIMGKVSADDSYHNVDQEWEELARALDRCLFITFFAFYIFTAVSLLM